MHKFILPVRVGLDERARRTLLLLSPNLQNLIDWLTSNVGKSDIVIDPDGWRSEDGIYVPTTTFPIIGDGWRIIKETESNTSFVYEVHLLIYSSSSSIEYRLANNHDWDESYYEP